VETGLCFSHFCNGAKARTCRALPPDLVGKLAGPGRLNTVAAGQLIHMQDQITNRRFLVDTSASYSIIPHRSSLPATGPKLFGPAGQLIPCWGDRLVQLQFTDQDFSWDFLLAGVAFPILGVDFLRFHKLLIDPEGHALLDSTVRRFAGKARPSPPMATVVVDFAQPYQPAKATSSLAHIAGPVIAGPVITGAESSPPHTARAASARAASAGAASAGAASAGAASSSAHTAGPASSSAHSAGSASKQSP
jgi:hypothetical protein